MISNPDDQDTVALPTPNSSPARAGSRLRPGDLVGRFTITTLLGAGGMAEVYRARDSRLGRDVALKLVRAPEPTQDACGSLCSLLMREAQTLAKLSHPGVVTVHDVGEHGGCVYLAMELIDGGTLRDWTREGHDWQEGLRHLIAAGHALAAAHNAGIVHRDVKPDNILIDRSGRVVVSDFGLARTLADLDEASHACGCSGGATVRVRLDGMVVGSPAYMSPEQRDGKTADALSDQFSFAVTCWETLHGALPPGSGEATSAPTSAVPEVVVTALLRSMQASPGARYATLTALLDQLTAAGGSTSRRD